MAQGKTKNQRVKNIILLAFVFICVGLVLAEMAINVSDWFDGRQSALPATSTPIRPTRTPKPSSTPRMDNPTDTPVRPTVKPTITQAVEDEA